MSKDLSSPQQTPRAAKLADEAIEQMFGYFSREPRPDRRAANETGARVISELDAAAAILAARRAA